MKFADNLKQRPAIDLQLFGEGDEPEQSTEGENQPAQPDPQQVQNEEPSHNSLSDFLKHYEEQTGKSESEPQEEAPTESTSEETESPPDEKSEEEQLILGKFKTQEDLINAYQEAEKRISRYGQYSAQARKELEQLRNQVAELQQYQKQQQPQQSEEAKKEEIEKRNQEWLDKFYDNPIEAIEEEVQKRVRREVEPLQREREMQKYTQYFQSQVEDARQKYPDFDELTPKMDEIIKQQGKHLASLPNAIEVVYNMAKAQSVPSTSKQDLLKDENFRQEILKDESIRNEILKQYAQQTKEKQPPVVLGKQHGESPASPPEQIQNTKDAKKASIGLFQRLAGGGSE